MEILGNGIPADCKSAASGIGSSSLPISTNFPYVILVGFSHVSGYWVRKNRDHNSNRQHLRSMPEGLRVLSDEQGQYKSSRSILTLEADKRPSERHRNAGNGNRTEFRVNGVTFHYPERITFCIQKLERGHLT